MPVSTLLAHEWLAPVGGSENVFEALSSALHGADRLCLWNDAPDRFGTDVRESWLAGTPLRRSKAVALPFMPHAWRSIDLAEYSRVVVSSHAMAHLLAGKAAREGKDAFAYIHSPARYLWEPELDSRGSSRFARAAAGRMRKRDRLGTSPAVRYAANSSFVQQRIARSWRVESEVIYPPVDLEKARSAVNPERLPSGEAEALTRIPETFIFGASRLVRYKQLDLVIAVGDALGLPVVISGVGSDLPRLRAIAEGARVPVTFLGRTSDDFLVLLFQRAALYVFPPVEDFGIMPVEAMAAGTPVVVNKLGGAAESVTYTGGGVIASTTHTSELVEAAEQALRIDLDGVQDLLDEFSLDRFLEKVELWVSHRSP